MTRSAESTARKVASQKVIKVTPTNKRLLKEFAARNHMSVSEVMRAVMSKVVSGDLPARIPETKTSLGYWDSTDLTDRMAARARRLGVPATDLLDAALTEVLR